MHQRGKASKFRFTEIKSVADGLLIVFFPTDIG
jgi:hypothetical protein